MEYAQLNQSLTEAIQVTTHGNVEWDADNFCSAEALTRDGKADQFRVVPLTVTEPPSYDPLAQSVIRDGCELVDGAWRHKWRVDALSAEQIEAKRVAAVPATVSPRQIRQALSRVGLRARVEAAVEAGDQDLKDWWEFSSLFERTNPQVTAMGTALAVTGPQLDALWTLAGSLQ